MFYFLKPITSRARTFNTAARSESKNERAAFHARLRNSPTQDKRGFDLISDALPFGKLWYGQPNAIGNAGGYAKFYSRSHDAVIRVCE
jgi:hypothetical protein